MPDNNENIETKESQVDETQAEETEEEKSFSQDDVNRIVAERVAKEQKATQKKIEEAVEKAKTEAGRLSNLTKEERESEEKRKLEDELNVARAELMKLHLENDTVERLQEEELPLDFKEFLIAEDAESTDANIKLFKPLFLAAVQTEVEKRLKGYTPKGSSSAGSSVKKKDTQSDMADYTASQRVI